jgi:hypothetical protein
MKSSRSRSQSRSNNKIAIKTNPALWERVKNQVMKGSKGGPSGKWSARKAQLSVKLYKSRGGGYKGSRSSSNSLTKWSKEKWGYISSSTRSSRSRSTRSRSTRSRSRNSAGTRKGRYLPLVVRKHLSSRTKSDENRKKGSKRGKWVPYTKETSRLMRKFKII